MRRIEQTQTETANTWEDARRIAESLSFRQALVYEQAQWPAGAGLLKRAFWSRDDVPSEFRGVEMPGRPDVRAILSGDPDDLEAHRQADRSWIDSNARWHEERLEWLRQQARGA